MSPNFTYVESSCRYIENQQTCSTITFGWDDASDLKVLKNVSVNSFNGVSDFEKNMYHYNRVDVAAKDIFCTIILFMRSV